MDPATLRRTLTLANAFKEGDLAVGGTADDRLRDDAREAVSALTIGGLRRTALVDDGVTAALDGTRDRQFDGDLDPLTIARLRAILLGPGAAAWARRHRDALPSEAIAAVVKVMSGDELSRVACALFNPLSGDGVAIGAPDHFGSRIQPNSPGDDGTEILFSILEGLSFGCGDVILGLNPAADELDTIVRLERLLEQVVARLELPTRFCVLSDLAKQDAARRRTRVDVGFQSLAGTSRALAGMVGLDADGVLDLARGFDGLYFETGQGSAVTNGAAEGVDMVTLESRAYGVARFVAARCAAARPDGRRPWMIVNDVAGFIGPEVFRDEAQLERACLEDAVMAKLHGLTIGLDVCATFHMGIAPSALRALTARVARRAAPAYLMAVAGNADPMLGYLTTAFRDHAPLRNASGRQLATPMRRRLAALDALGADGTPRPGDDTVARLYARFVKAGGDARTTTALEDEARARLHELRERGFDLGGRDGAAADARIEAIYAHARAALYATLDAGVLRDATAAARRVRTAAADRDDYLARPPAGERLRPDDARMVAGLHDRPPRMQIVVSDGLNAQAVNEQLRAILPPLRRRLAGDGHAGAARDVVVDNGRVRAGYEIGGLVRADLVVHLIGERPGTGLNTLSAYLTYGRDAAGEPRWAHHLDHAHTTAVCGIHPRGKPPAAAVDEIARTVGRILEQRASGVALT